MRLLAGLFFAIAGIYVIFVGWTSTDASHTRLEDGENDDLLWSDLHDGGDGEITYWPCPGSFPSQWLDGIGEWGSELPEWSFDPDYESNCIPPFDVGTVLDWEGDIDDCDDVDPVTGGEVYACWNRDLSQGLSCPYGATYCYLPSAVFILFDQDRWGNLSLSWKTALSAHEWGHNLDLADHHEDTMCALGTLMGRLASPLSGTACITGPTPSDLASVRCGAYNACSCDFDGGWEDLAVGVTWESFPNGKSYAGAIAAIYGTSPGGLASSGNQFLHQDTNPAGSDSTVEVYDYFGKAVACGDFDGDGYGDLAIGVHKEDLESSGDTNAGAVNVMYGSPSGLDAYDFQFLTQDTNPSSSDSNAEDEDWYGAALAVCNFDGDSYDDLAIGVPLENLESSNDTDAGAVNVVYGSASGLNVYDFDFLTQDSNPSSTDSNAENDDRFGTALACGDFDYDGEDDLAAGTPLENLESTGDTDAGAVNVFYGTPNGLSTSGTDFIAQDGSYGIDGDIYGDAEAGDEFGSALAVGEFNMPGPDDLAIGAAKEDVGSLIDAGAVNVVYGSGNGLNAAGEEQFTQNTLPSSVATAEAGDRFGEALAAGAFGTDVYEGLAVGVPGEDIGTSPVDAGVINVIYGDSSGGLTASGADAFSQNSCSGNCGPETGDEFGRALAACDFNGDGKDDLAIGVPLEEISGEDRAGAVNALYAGDNGLSASAGPGFQMWHQDTAGIEGGAEAGDRFGLALAPCRR
jgi:hypothetical protein